MEEQLEIERKIELVKQDLVLHSDVTLPRICAIFDPDGKGNLGAVDLLDVLRKLGLNPGCEAAYLVFSRFDTDMDGRWDYKDIAAVITPLEEEYADIIDSRVSKDISTSIRNEALSVLKRLMATYIEAEIENECKKDRLRGINVKKAFSECDVDDIGFFTAENVILKKRSMPFN